MKRKMGLNDKSRLFIRFLKETKMYGAYLKNIHKKEQEEDFFVKHTSFFYLIASFLWEETYWSKVNATWNWFLSGNQESISQKKLLKVLKSNLSKEDKKHLNFN